MNRPLCSAGLVLLFLATVIGPSAGCGPARSDGASHASLDTARDLGDRWHEDSDPVSALVLEHDFGVVRPRSANVHRFMVQNDTKSEWTVKRFHVRCNCTVPGASVSRIAPGQSGTFDLLYKAPPRACDDDRSVTIEFSEQGAPTVQLHVHAEVRPPMATSQDQVVFTQLRNGLIGTHRLTVMNFSEEVWESVAVDCDAAWLDVEETRPGEAETMTFAGCRQRWCFIVSAKPDGLSTGRHYGLLKCTARGANDSFEKTVDVILDVAPPVVTIPDRMFFGTIPTGEDSTAKCTIVCHEVQVRSQPAVTHDLGQLLDATVERSSKAAWLLTVRIRPVESGILSGTIVVLFADPTIAPVKIPVTAKAVVK